VWSSKKTSVGEERQGVIQIWSASHSKGFQEKGRSKKSFDAENCLGTSDVQKSANQEKGPTGGGKKRDTKKKEKNQASVRGKFKTKFAEEEKEQGGCRLNGQK